MGDMGECRCKKEMLSSKHKRLEPCCTLIYRYMTQEERELNKERESHHLKEHMRVAMEIFGDEPTT